MVEKGAGISDTFTSAAVATSPLDGPLCPLQLEWILRMIISLS